MALSAVLSLAASLAVSVPDPRYPRDSLALTARARHVDHASPAASWTAASTGCACWWDASDTSCACCENNGCQCGCENCGATAKQVCSDCSDTGSCRQAADDLVLTRLQRKSSADQEPSDGTQDASTQERAAEIIKDMFPKDTQATDNTSVVNDTQASNVSMAYDTQSMQASSNPLRMKWYYCMDDNVGDVLNRDLANCISNHTKSVHGSIMGFSNGIDFELTMAHDMEGKILGVGSVIEMALQKNDLVLGAGSLHACSSDMIPGDPDSTLPPGDVMATVTVAATRGVLSAHCTNVDVERVKMGDPALFLPYMCPAWQHLTDMDTSGRNKTCLIPHQEERSLLKAYEAAMARGEAEEFMLLDTQTSDALGFVESLTTHCKRVVSASLHGIILSDAVQIPSMRWMNPKAVCNGEPTYPSSNQTNPLRPTRMEMCDTDEPHSTAVSSVKFDDYYSGIGWEPKPAREEIVSLDSISDWEVCCGPRISREEIEAKAGSWLDGVMLHLKQHLMPRVQQRAASSSTAADSTPWTPGQPAVDSTVNSTVHSTVHSTVNSTAVGVNQSDVVSGAEAGWRRLLSSEAGREAEAAADRAVAEMMKAAGDKAAKAADDEEGGKASVKRDARNPKASSQGGSQRH